MWEDLNYAVTMIMCPDSYATTIMNYHNINESISGVFDPFRGSEANMRPSPFQRTFLLETRCHTLPCLFGEAFETRIDQFLCLLVMNIH